MKLKQGIQYGSILSGILFSLAMIAGCNTDDTTTTSPSTASPSGAPGKTVEPPKMEPKAETATPPPPSKPDMKDDMPKEPTKP